MDARGIRQWNVTDYLKIYPQSYYACQQELGNLYTLKNKDQIVGAAVVLLDDSRWRALGNPGAVYIHNLATDYRVKGAGKPLLMALETDAILRGYFIVRLDCSKDNVF